MKELKWKKSKIYLFGIFELKGGAHFESTEKNPTIWNPEVLLSVKKIYRHFV